MRRVLLALLAEAGVSSVLTVWGIRLMVKAERSIPLFGELPFEGLTPQMYGLVLTVVSACTLAATLWRLIPLVRCLWLERTLQGKGVTVRGVITDLHQSKVIQVNQTCSVRLTIQCTAPSGKELEFRSPILWAPEAQVGEGVDVIFDPEDEERCFIRLVEKKYVRESLKDQGKRRFY